MKQDSMSQKISFEAGVVTYEKTLQMMPADDLHFLTYLRHPMHYSRS